MKLNIKERFALRTVFPPQRTSLLENDLYDEFLGKVKITSEEVKQIDMKVDGSGLTTWEASKDKGIEVEISQPLLNLLKEAVKAADQEKRIPYDPDDKTVVNLARKILNYQVEQVEQKK